MPVRSQSAVARTQTWAEWTLTWSDLVSVRVGQKSPGLGSYTSWLPHTPSLSTPGDCPRHSSPCEEMKRVALLPRTIV